MCCGLVKEVILAVCDGLFLLESTDDALASHRFVEVAVDGSPKG